jgi:iron(III) transport system permease protein
MPTLKGDIAESSWLKRALSQFVGYGTLTIVLLMLFFFLVLPVSLIIGKAFYHDGQITLNYFFLLFENDLQTSAIWQSIKIGVATTILCIIVSIPLASISVRWDFRFKALLSGLLLTPMVMPPFVGAIGVQRFFARLGSVNLFLMEMGWISEPIEWLSEGNKFWAVVVLEVLHLYPIMYLNLSAALANVDPSLEEMAATLGTPKWRRAKDIVWPLAAPGLFAGAIIVFIWALTDLGTPLLVGFHDTIPVRIFNMVTDVQQNPVGFALVFVVIMLTIFVFMASKFIFGRKKYDMMAKGHVTSSMQRAGPLRATLIYIFMLAVICLALIPHVSVFITSIGDKWFMTVLPENFTLKYYQQMLQMELPLIGIKNSFLLALASTFFDLCLGLMVAYVVVRKLIPFSGALDGLVMLPLALPGIVLAFGYVVTYSDTFLDPMHNPIPLLIIAYGIRRLPFMVRSASAGLQQTSVSLEEASYTFGASRFYTLRKIVFPLVLANLIAGGLLCFAYAMLDVSDSLILAMKEQYYPLTKAIYALFLEQGSGEFVASALGMVGMLILTLCILGASLILGKKMGELFRS